MPRGRKKSLTSDTLQNIDKDHFVYCDNRKCPYKTCIRRIEFAPFEEMLYVKRFQLDKDSKCAGLKERWWQTKKIFVINGSGGVGKDTFIKFVSEEVNDIFKKLHTVWNYSSVDKIKNIATEIGWSGGKSEKDRKFLSDLKYLASEYCDMPFKSMKSKVYNFLSDDNAVFLFLHIREPGEIQRAVDEIEKMILSCNVKTILVVRDNVPHITSNDADKNVFNYNYDLMVINNGTINDLRKYAKEFVKTEMEGDKLFVRSENLPCW